MKRFNFNRLSRVVVLYIASLVLLGPSGASAHDVPADVIVRAWMSPADGHANLLVRVPLEAMRDVRFPMVGPGYLDIAAADEFLNDAATIWIGNQIELYEGERRLDNWRIEAARVSLPSDRSFDEYRTAYAHILAPPLPDSTELFWNQALFDVLIRYPVNSESSEFSIYPNFVRLGVRTTTVLRFVSHDGVERPFEFSGDPGIVRLDPRWHHAFFRFLTLGFEHILGGVDHLLFVLCLIVPFRRLRPLIVIVTSFTVAHTITLLSSAFAFAPKALWFPPLIETLIAASIVYMAIENIVGSRWQRRWLIAFGFGLVHGFAFSFALSNTLQFAGAHLLTSLLAFNIGVELGQLLVILFAVPVLNWLFRSVVAERVGTIILSALLAHSGWHWMSERASALAAYGLQLPSLDLAFLAALMRWTMLVLIIGLALWTMFTLYKRLLAGDRPSRPDNDASGF